MFSLGRKQRRQTFETFETLELEQEKLSPFLVLFCAIGTNYVLHVHCAPADVLFQEFDESLAPEIANDFVNTFAMMFIQELNSNVC